MKNIEVYKERMDVTMTEEEKLFFVRHVDFSTVGTIIDFGGANGSLLWQLCKLQPDLQHVEKFIVDNNPQMITEYPLENTKRVGDIFDIKQMQPGKVLVIFSSVLHECSRLLTYQLTSFCLHFADIVVIRDMCYHGGNHPERKSFEEFEAYEVIKNNPEWLRLFNELKISSQQFWMQSIEETLTHFILKYTYTENAESEAKENYFCNNAAALAKLLIDKGWEYLYQRNYPLPYKAKQAAEVFNWPDLPDTHTQRILVRP